MMRTILLLAITLQFVYPDVICPDGYENWFGDKCYQKVDDELSWNDARNYCRTMLGGDLASIHSQEENDAIKTAIAYSDNFWIGLQCLSKTLVWSDGSTVDFHKNVYPCESDYSSYFYYCLTGSWEELSPVSIARFLCKTAGISARTTTTAAAPFLTGSSCGLGYTLIDDRTCVRIGTNQTTWTEAEADCQLDGGHLASVHSKRSNERIRQLAIANRQTNAVFVGFQFNNSIPTWTDGNDFDYSNFDPGMPNALFGMCGAMQTVSLNGEWTSVFCDDSNKLGFICTKPQPCPASNTFAVSGNFSSPEYPSSRSSGLTCEYFIAVSPGSLVLLRFDEFQLVDGDQVILYEGEGNGDPLEIVTSAASTDRFMTKTLSVMRIVHQTGSGGGIRKWHATFGGF